MTINNTYMYLTDHIQYYCKQVNWKLQVFSLSMGYDITMGQLENSFLARQNGLKLQTFVSALIISVRLWVPIQ